jgi:hypothetical protein
LARDFIQQTFLQKGASSIQQTKGPLASRLCFHFEMEWTADWRLRALLICAFGIIKEFRPATPFLTPFLENEPKNFTNVELYSQIFPFSTYSYLLSMASCFI